MAVEGLFELKDPPLVAEMSENGIHHLDVIVEPRHGLKIPFGVVLDDEVSNGCLDSPAVIVRGLRPNRIEELEQDTGEGLCRCRVDELSLPRLVADELLVLSYLAAKIIDINKCLRQQLSPEIGGFVRDARNGWLR